MADQQQDPETSRQPAADVPADPPQPALAPDGADAGSTPETDGTAPVPAVPGEDPQPQSTDDAGGRSQDAQEAPTQVVTPGDRADAISGSTGEEAAAASSTGSGSNAAGQVPPDPEQPPLTGDREPSRSDQARAAADDFRERAGEAAGEARQRLGTAAETARDRAGQFAQGARERAANTDVNEIAHSTTSLIATAKPFFLATFALLFTILAVIVGDSGVGQVFAIGAVLAVIGAAFSSELSGWLGGRRPDDR